MYIKEISRFIEDVNNDFENSVLNVLRINKSVYDDDAEEQSWKESLPVLADVLKELPDSVRNGCQIVLEAKYSVEEKRADVVLIGTNNDRKVVIFIENKRWSDLSKYSPEGNVTVWDPYHKQMVDHPSRQANHYKTTLRYMNKYVQDENVCIDSLVFMQNATANEKMQHEGPFNHKYQSLMNQSPIFTNDEREEMLGFINERILSGEPGIAEAIYTSEVHFSEEYKKILGNLFGARESLLNLLDDKQITLFDEIARDVNKGKEKKIYIIEGKPGTGKTFIAIALLSYLFQEKQNNIIRYVEKNRDPRKTLAKEMNVPKQAMLYSLRNQDTLYDCLICDESHRMLENIYKGEDERLFIDRFLELSRVSVFFYDEKQRVHVSDYVTKERIIEAACNRGINHNNIICSELNYQHRCKGADEFLDIIGQVLDNSEIVPKDFILWEKDTYKVALLDDPRKVFQLIREKDSARGKAHSSRVLAGKGRTFGSDWKWTYKNKDYNACKSIAPLRGVNQKLYTWNFGEYGEEVTFASDDNSIRLVGCIDTSQGLDFEYIGVIIAPDLVYNPDTQKVEVCIAGHQKSDPNTGGKDIDNLPFELIERVIKNTYGVLLSRGEKGCYIYCYDKKLQDYLSQIIPMIDVDLEPVENGRVLGCVTYVDHDRRFAYITDSNGQKYAVSTNTYDRLNNPTQTLVKDNSVSFTVWISEQGKKYANDVTTV